MKCPSAVAAGLSDLLFDGDALVVVEATGVFSHFRSRFDLAHRVGELPTMPVLDPPPLASPGNLVPYVTQVKK